jgi:hypothetical protein
VIYYGQEKENRSKEKNRNQNLIQEKEKQEIIPAILFLDLVQRQQHPSDTR